MSMSLQKGKSEQSTIIQKIDFDSSHLVIENGISWTPKRHRMLASNFFTEECDQPLEFIKTSKNYFSKHVDNNHGEECDTIILGSGLKECILSALLIANGKKVVQLNMYNNVNGDDVATTQLNLLAPYLQKIEKPEFNFIDPFAPKFKGQEIWIDQAPKFNLASGKLTKILLKEGLAANTEFMKVHSAYFARNGQAMKIPMNEQEVQNSPIMSWGQKNCFKLFLLYVDGYEEHSWTKNRGLDLHSLTTQWVFRFFLLKEETQHFIGHAMAFHTDDHYLQQPAIKTVLAIKTYIDSFFKFGDTPFLYHRRGYSNLVKKWFMHNTEVQREDEAQLKRMFFDSATNEALGVSTKDKVYKAPILVGNAKWFPKTKARCSNRIIRAYCVMLETPNFMDSNADSSHLIIPGKEQQNECTKDIYVCVLSSFQDLCPEGVLISIISKVVETDAPSDELEPAFAYLPQITQRYDDVRVMYSPADDGASDHCFVFSDNYSESCTFEEDMEEVLSVYEKVTGSKLDLSVFENTKSIDNSGEECKEQAAFHS